MSARSPLGQPIVGRPRRSLGSSEVKISQNDANGHHNRHSPAYGKDDDEFIPQVPRIPDRFQPRRDPRLDPRPARSSEDEKNVDLKSIPAPHTRYLPNCSIGKPKEVQVVSNAMMQAYVAMRGNYLGGQGGHDPLFGWIQQREELAYPWKPKIHHKRDVSRMLQLIDKALESSNMGGDSPRDHVFEVYRPEFDHIKPPQNIDMSPHVFAASCGDFEWEDDSDDEEADVPSGRISPCTFMEWSKDCVRWNAENIENKKDTTSYLRMRPPTPKVPAPPRRHEHVPSSRFEPQWDIHTGEELTPTYRVPTSPSIIYTPPGIEFTGFRTPNFHAQYRRMAPLVERELRTKLYGGQEVFPRLSDGEKDRFSPSTPARAGPRIPRRHRRVGSPADLYKAADDYLLPEGTFVQIGGDFTVSAMRSTASRALMPSILGGGKRAYKFVQTQTRHDDLVQLGQWMQEGKIRAVVDGNIFPFEEAPKAFEKLMTKRTRGNLVIKVSN
ncbi:hypothetical protein EKO27_g2407 [Xylaria grammica]|uniref:Enoyl reductase (ER) domain-containing protein n=1 Tax=Xylaria grammica TaxID=363999 RepID=A0A439DE41_9PEZI|nr:hypothetical protein EKO27_g2407 [Xylaria grammica]